MQEPRELTFEDYVAKARRHMWRLAIPTVLIGLLAYGGSLLVPNLYTSQTSLMIEQPAVPANYVQPVVSEDLNQRLSRMQEQILSRTRLQPIIERFALYKNDLGKVPMEELVERMRKNVRVSPLANAIAMPRAGLIAGFSVSFTSENPRIAQQVCGEIISMFMDENLRARQKRAEGTTDFLRSQVEEAKRKLDEQDSKLAAFKTKYFNQLPGHEQTAMTMLTTLNGRLDAVTQALSRAQQDKTYAESMLAQQLTAWQASQSSSNPQELERQLVVKQQLLLALESRYMNDHPDVIKARNEVELLKKRIAAAATEKKEVSAQSNESPNLPLPIQQLKLDIARIDQTIRSYTMQQERIQTGIEMYQARLQLSPAVEEEYKILTRGYQSAQTFYDGLIAKSEQSEMATDLERAQQGEQFRVMDPPNLPEKPSSPDRLKISFGGLLAGLALGVVLSVFSDLRDKGLRNDGDVEQYLQLGTLVLMPHVGEEVLSVASRNTKWKANVLRFGRQKSVGA